MVTDREGFTTRYPGRVSLSDWSREASARMEFEPLSDVFLSCVTFWNFMLSFAVWSHVGARFLLSVVSILSEWFVYSV